MKRILIFICSLLFIDLGWANNPMNYYANKAEESLRMGNFEDALDYARQEMIDYENNPNGYYQAAVSYYALQQPGQSLSLLNKAIEKAKKNKELATRCFLTKSEVLKEIGDTVQALNALNDGIKIDGKNIDLLVNRGSLLAGIDNKSALKDLQKVKKIAPGDPRGYIYTSYVYTTDNQYKEALDEITRAIAIDNTISYSYALRGMILQQLGNSPDWIRDCLKSFELDKESSLGIILLAGVEDANVREQIINEIEHKLTVSNEYYTLEANLLYTWSEFVLAGKKYDEIISLEIADPNTYFYLCDCQKRLGFIIDAYTTASKGLDKFPNELSLKLMKAQVGVIAGKGAEVLGILSSLIAQSPESDALYVEKGKAYMSLGRYSDAVEPLSTAVILNPSAMNKMYYGDALRLSGDISKANSEYNDILQINDDVILGEGLSPLSIYAMAYSGLGDRTKATETIKALASIQPEAEISFLPSIYARLGLKAEAINALKEYSNNNTWNALFDLYSYNFFNLHSEPDFVKLLSDNGVTTKYNELSHLLEFVPDGIPLSSGGTSIEDVMALTYDSMSDYVKKINQLCPIDMGIAGQIVSVEFNENTLTTTYNCVMNPVLFNFDIINTNPSYKKKKEDIMTLGFISQNTQFENSGMSLKYKITTPDKSKESILFITPSRIKELMNKLKSQDEIDKMMLDFWYEEETLSFPNNPMTQNTTIDFDGHTLAYTYPISENDGSFSRVELFKSDMKKQISSLFNDLSMKDRISVYIRQNITIKFIYKGDQSGRTVEIEFAPHDLLEYQK